MTETADRVQGDELVEARPNGPAAAVEQLVAARQAAGLGASDIAAKLGMSTRQIEALERGDWQALPGQAFVRGALRSYGKTTGVDIEPLLASIGGQVRAPELRASVSLDAPIPRGGGLGFGSGGSGSRLVWIVLGVVAVIAMALYFGDAFELGQSAEGGSATVQEDGSRTSQAVTGQGAGAGSGAAGTAALSGAASAAPGSSATGGGSGSSSASTSRPAIMPLQPLTPLSPLAPGASSSDASGASSPAGSAGPGVVPSAPSQLGAPAGGPGSAVPSATGSGASQAGGVAGAGTAGPASAGAAATGTPAGAAASAGSEPSTAKTADTLKLRFARESWVDIRGADGKVLLIGTQPAGSNRELSGRRPIKLVIGNAEHVTLEAAGKPVDLSGRLRQGVARLTLD